MDKDLHFFTIGAGALLNSSSSIAQVLGISQIRNSCYQGNVLKFLQNSLAGVASGQLLVGLTGIFSGHKLKCITDVTSAIKIECVSFPAQDFFNW